MKIETGRKRDAISRKRRSWKTCRSISVAGPSVRHTPYPTAPMYPSNKWVVDEQMSYVPTTRSRDWGWTIRRRSSVRPWAVQRRNLDDYPSSIRRDWFQMTWKFQLKSVNFPLESNLRTERHQKGTCAAGVGGRHCLRFLLLKGQDCETQKRNCSVF